MSLKIEIELNYAGGQAYNEDGDSHPIDIDEAIVLAAAQELLRMLVKDNGYRSLRERADSIKDEEIRQFVKPLVAEAVAHSLQPTDQWGNPHGSAVTLAEYIIKVGADYLAKETGEYNRRETVVRKFIREEVNRQIQGELKNALEQAKREVIDAVKEQGAQVMAATIAKMAGVS